MDFDVYIKDIKKVTGNRKHLITNSYGTHDYYRWYLKNIASKRDKLRIPYLMYSTIINRMNEKLADHLCVGETLTFPMRLGRVDIREFKIEPKIDKDGNLVYNAGVNWCETLKLWHTDADAESNKVLVKLDYDRNYRTLYTKNRLNFPKKYALFFKINRNIKKKISSNASKGLINAYTTKTWHNNT